MGVSGAEVKLKVLGSAMVHLISKGPLSTVG